MNTQSKVINSWSDFERCDLKNLLEIEKLGWNRNFHYEDIRHQRINIQNPPQFKLSFINQDYTLWFANNMWIIAKKIDGRYENHKRFNSIVEAVNTFKHNRSMFD